MISLSFYQQASHINEVCAASEQRGPSTDELQEQLVQKMENALKNREDQLKGLQNRLAEHVSHSDVPDVMHAENADHSVTAGFILLVWLIKIVSLDVRGILFSVVKPCRFWDVFWALLW